MSRFKSTASEQGADFIGLNATIANLKELGYGV